MDKALLKEIILEQAELLECKEIGIEREIVPVIDRYIKVSQAVVVSGIRCAGNYTLLKQIIEKYHKGQGYYFNFEDERLCDFKISDFNSLLEVFVELLGERDEAIKFIRRNTRLSYKIKDIKREEIPEYPTEALREAIVNAVMHRDYFETSANVQVDISNDRIEISNVGALIKPLTKEKLGTIAVRRNPLIADLFHRIGYVEKMGTGLRRIKEECRKHRTKLKIETDGYFIITFKSNKIITQKTTQKTTQKILDLIRRNPQMSQKELAEEIGITQDGIKYHLASFKRKGILKRIGPDKGGHWEVI